MNPIHITANINRWTLAWKINDLANVQALLPYAHNGRHDLIIAYISDMSSECSPIHIVSNIIKLCD